MYIHESTHFGFTLGCDLRALSHRKTGDADEQSGFPMMDVTEEWRDHGDF